MSQKNIGQYNSFEEVDENWRYVPEVDSFIVKKASQGLFPKDAWRHEKDVQTLSEVFTSKIYKPHLNRRSSIYRLNIDK